MGVPGVDVGVGVLGVDVGVLGVLGVDVGVLGVDVGGVSPAHKLSENSDVLPSLSVTVADKQGNSVVIVMAKCPELSATPSAMNCVPAGVLSGLAKSSTRQSAHIAPETEPVGNQLCSTGAAIGTGA